MVLNKALRRRPLFILTIIMPLAIVAVLLPLRNWLTTTDVAMLQLLWVTWVAQQAGRRWAIVNTAISVVLLDWFFVLPYYTLEVHHLDYLITFAVMLLLGVFISQLSGRLRNELARARNIMSQMRGMFMLAKGLAQRQYFNEQREFALKLLQHRLRSPVRWLESDSEHDSTDVVQLRLPLSDNRKVFGYLQLAVAAYHQNRTLVNTAQSLLQQMYQRQRLTEQSRQAQIQAEVEQSKTLMLRSISHDLRTPLATIMGASSMLADTSLTLNAEEIQQQAKNIYQQSTLLNEHFDKVMELSRVQQPDKMLSIDTRPVADIISGAIARRSHQLNQSLLNIDIDEHAQCTGDAALLEIAVANMLENAVRHGGEPVAIHFSQSKDNCLTITNPWRTTDKAPRDSGTGLGLPICRVVAQLHGGQFELHCGKPGTPTEAKLCWPEH